MADLNRAFLTAGVAVTKTSKPGNHIKHSSSYYSSLYKGLGNLAGLQKAITAVEAAVTATPLDYTNLPAILGNLSNRLVVLYGRLGDLADLGAAVGRASTFVGGSFGRGHR